MAKRFTSTSFAPPSVSEEQRQAAAQQQVDSQTITPELPSQTLLEATPQAAPSQPTSTPVIPSAPTPNAVTGGPAVQGPTSITSLADAITQNTNARQQRAAAPPSDLISPHVQAGGTDPRALKLPSARGEPSAPAAEVQGVNVPVADAPAGLGQFESEAERIARYDTEQQRQAPMNYNQVFDSISGLGTASEASFNSAAKRVAFGLGDEAASNPRIRDSLTKAGVIDETGTVSDTAARSMLFTMAAEAARVEEQKSDTVTQLQQSLLSGEITEDKIDEKMMYAVNRPDFDRQNLQTTFASNFQRQFGDAMGIDADLRVDDPQALSTSLNPQDQSLFAVTTGKVLKDLGFVDEVVREQDGVKRSGYNIKDDFMDLMIDIAPVLEEFNSAFRKGVTFTPNIGGVPSGQASLLHRESTRAAKGQRATKGKEVYQALDVMGKTAFGVNKLQLGANAVILESIMDQKWLSPGGGFSRHPLAEHFLLGAGTFMKYFKDDQIHSIDDLNRIFVDVKNRADQGDVNAQQRFLELEEKIEMAKTTQAFVAKTYIKAQAEGAKLNGKSFYHTQTMIAGNSRVMVGSTEFNYQANKKARGLTANPQPHLVTPDKPNVAATKAFKQIIARNLAHNADRAPSSKALNDMFNDLVNDQEMVELAKWTFSHMPQRRSDVDAYAKTTTEYRTQAQLSSPTPGNVLPGLDPNYPQFGAKLPDNELMLTRLGKAMEVLDSAGNPQKSDEGDFKLMALRDLGAYLNGRPFMTQITAEADGIANGLIIQGSQFGATDVVKRGGLLYDSDTTVTPDGDMRKLLQDVIIGEVDAGTQAMNSVFSNPTEAAKWISAYTNTIGRENEKALHKLPAMTTPYGMDADYHHTNIRKFLDGNSIVKGRLMSELGINNEAELVDNMAKIEAAALKAGLGGVIQHQAIVKNAYNAAIAGGELFEVKGPNGWNIISGGIDYETISDESITFSDGAVSRVLTRKPVGTPYGKAKGKEEGHITKLGSKGKNQSAVFGTQNIDATVAQRTMVNTKAEMGDNFWGGQVFDAFIGDIGSFEALVSNANKEFKKVNQTYSMVDAEIEAVQAIRSKVRKKAMDAKKLGLKFDVTENGEYQGLYFILKRLKNEQAGSEKASGRTTSPLQRRLARKKTFGSKIGFRFDGSQMTPDQFVEAWEYVVKTLEVESSLKAFKQQADADRAKMWKDIAEQERQGRLVGQYR